VLSHPGFVCEFSMGTHQSICYSAERLRRLNQAIDRQIGVWRSTLVCS
jgi:hypothetical protein